MGNTEFPSQFTEKEIQKLYARFQEIDTDKSGDLDPEEIFNVPELNQNPLVKRVISVFDTNSDGKISFKEFLEGKTVLIFEVLQLCMVPTMKRNLVLRLTFTIWIGMGTSRMANSSQS